MRGAELLGAGNAAAGRFIPVGVVDSVAAHDPCAVRVHERDWHSIAITSAVRLVGSKQPRLPEESRQPGRPIPLERSEISARPRDATERRVYRPLESRWEFLTRRRVTVGLLARHPLIGDGAVVSLPAVAGQPRVRVSPVAVASRGKPRSSDPRESAERWDADRRSAYEPSADTRQTWRITRQHCPFLLAEPLAHPGPSARGFHAPSLQRPPATGPTRPAVHASVAWRSGHLLDFRLIVMLQERMKKIGFLSFGHWSASPISIREVRAPIAASSEILTSAPAACDSAPTTT